MCGRYVAPDGTLVEGALEVREWLPAVAKIIKVPDMQTNYNASPTQFVPIITESGAVLARFGLIPPWATDSKYTMINAMSETLEVKKSFRGLLPQNRCLIPAMGFYEWKLEEDTKQPYYFSLSERNVFMFAGLYTHRTDPDGYTSYSFTIITTAPNSLIKGIHNRMPAILEERDEEMWVKGTTDEALKLLFPYPADPMQSWKVGKSVGSPRNNSPELITPII